MASSVNRDGTRMKSNAGSRCTDGHRLNGGPTESSTASSVSSA